jgi:peroxisomal 2,4-dienoyl-CoA reductase
MNDISSDVRDYKSCEAAVAKALQHFGSIDILVNCAAGNFLCLAEDLTPNGFKTGETHPPQWIPPNENWV